MNLEGKIAYWVDLGMKPYMEVYQLQEKLVNLRRQNMIPDMIIAAQHPLEVNFGASAQHNNFSQYLTNKVATDKPNPTHDDVVNYLNSYSCKFSRTVRGGGATVLSPGQLVYYPIVDYHKITGKNLDGVGDYKSRIYRVMFEALQSLGIKGINLGSDTGLSTREQRRDVWLQKDGVPYKLGSKGLRFSDNVAWHGFSLYIDNSCISPFRYVTPCGFTQNEVVISSVQKELGKQVDHDQVHQLVKEAIARNFNYGLIYEDVPINDLVPQKEVFA